MPSNQCTNSLMELSFAIGNMIGAQDCDVDDWQQLNRALLAWECSTTGKRGDALDSMKGTVTNAIKACASTDGCRATDCIDLFDNHEVMVQSLNIYEPAQLSQGLRGPIPPKIKGGEGLARNLGLAGQRDAEMKRIADRLIAENLQKRLEASARQEQAKLADEVAKKLAEEAKKNGGGSRYQNPSRGMGYGDEERKRWYPARA